MNSSFTGRTNSLFFGTSGDGSTQRQVTTDSFDITNGATINFDFIYGNDFNGGEEVDPTEEVVVEYSINGGSFSSGLEITITASSDKSRIIKNIAKKFYEEINGPPSLLVKKEYLCKVVKKCCLNIRLFLKIKLFLIISKTSSPCARPCLSTLQLK